MSTWLWRFVLYSLLIFQLSLTCPPSFANPLLSTDHVVCFDSLANTLHKNVANRNELSHLEDLAVLTLDDDIKSLLVLSNENWQLANNIFVDISRNKETFNLAEKFILLIIEANIYTFLPSF